MSDTTIDKIFELAWLGFEHQECEQDCSEADYYKQAKSALYDLILKEVVDDDELLDKDDLQFVQQHMLARNIFRAEMRSKLRELFG